MIPATPTPTPPLRRPALRRSGLARVVVGLLAVFQLMVGAAVPVLDAEAGHHQPVAAHIEDASQDGCPASHDAESCQLCQIHTAARVLPVAPAVPALPAVERHSVLVAHRAVAVATGFLDGHGSRAPPLG